MSNNTNSTGLAPPTIQGRTGSPQESAYNNMTQRNLSQANANAAMTSGGSMKKKGGAITVPQVPGDTSGANAVSTKLYGTSAQGQENAKYDNQATKGGKRSKRGGNADWLWGCYSGGKKRKTRTNKRKIRGTKKRKTRRNKK